MVIAHVRSRALLCVLPILVSLILASSASAQGFFSLPSLGGFFGTQQSGPSACDPCAPCPHLDFFVGWQGGHKQTLTAHTDQPTPGALFREIKFDTPNEGIWLGAAATADVSCKFNVALMGWYFFSSNKRGTYLVDPGIATPDPDGPLPPKVDWWYVDVMGKYRHWQNMSLLIGARFDHHNISSNDSNFGFVFPTPNPYRLDLDAFTTSLFFGMEYASDCGLTLRAIYAPFSWTSGRTKFGQSQLITSTALLGPNEVDTSKAVNPLYLAELFLEYTRPVSMGMKLGAFARGTWLHAAGNSTLNESVRSASASYDFSYDCQSWTIGGKAELAFNLSGLWY